MNKGCPIDHILQGSYFHKTLRLWHSANVSVAPANFIYPLFIHEKDDADEDIPSLPGIKRLGLNNLKDHLEPIIADGLKCILLFGVIDNEDLKDERGSYADSEKSSVVRSIPYLKKLYVHFYNIF
jgi:porphobilinogen synthase